jgi:hypothetical protein
MKRRGVNMTNSVRVIDASALTTFTVDPDGARARLNVRDQDDAPATLVLPLESLSQLLMTIPRMICQALQNGHGDESLRLVYPLEGYKLELGEVDWNGAQRFILTLETTGGFAVSFAGSADCLACMARSIFGDSRMGGEAGLPSRQLS